MIYQRRRSNTRLFTVIAVAAIAVIALVIFALTRNQGNPNAELDAARNRAQQAADGLDIFMIEYPKVAQGVKIEQTGAQGSLARARENFDAAKSVLARLDAAATRRVADALGQLDAQVKAQSPPGEVVALADAARKELLALAAKR